MSKSVRFGGSVFDAIKEKEKGQNGNYEMIMRKIQDPLAKSEDLLELLQQFREAVPLIDKSKEMLVFDLTSTKWATREKEVIQTYFDVLVDLASANSIHIIIILKCLFKHFVPESIFIKKITPSTPKEDIFELAHSTIQKVFTLIPMAISLAMPLLSITYPFITKDIDDLECNMMNLLAMTKYALPLRKHILELVVSKTLKIDLLCTREAIQKKNTDADDIMFEMDLEESDHEKFVEKLDTLLNAILLFVQETCQNEKRSSNADSIFDEFLYVFRKAILPVYDSSHIQFILFYICSFKVDYQRKFSSMLWDIAQYPNYPVLTRQIALCYIASFYARAKFMNVDDALNMVNSLSQWIHSYIHTRETGGCYGNGLHNATRHGVFYAACQALFYIIIFRIESIMNMTDGFETMRKIQIERIITSRMNPLRFCINTVVDVFSSQMRKHQIAYCDTIIEKNNRQCLPISGDPITKGAVNPLDSFFPFDPYTLKLSAHMFNGIYQHWEGRVPDSKENEEDSDNDEDTDNEPMDVAPGSPDIFGDENRSKRVNDISSRVFGISPGFSLITPSPY